MSRWPRLIFVISFLLIIFISIVPVHAKPPLEVAIKRQQLRNDYIRFEKIIDELDITEGITIVDIGSGPGYASFLFAEKLQGTGTVYATDIREDFVTYIAKEAKKRGLTNLFSAVVKAKGLDNFYTSHRYDIVFASNVYHAIGDPIAYFGQLRNYLNPDARLVIILYNQAPLFSADDIQDIQGIIDSLSRSSNDDPFIRNLSSTTKQLVAEKKNSLKLMNALVEDFNQMLTNPHFFEGFYDGSYFRKDMFVPSERELANWLLMILKEDGVLDKPGERLDAREMRSVIKLNRLFFQSRFGHYLANDGMGAYIPAGDANRNTSKYEMFRELAIAGYKFDREVKLSTYFDAIIMEPIVQ